MDKWKDEASAEKHHDPGKPKNGQETMNHLHTCIHAYIKVIFSFQEIKQGRPLRNKARYTMFCGNQELKPPRHETSNGRRVRQRGEARLRDRTLGARSAKN